MYIYHLIPEPFIGTSLIPLNSMERSSDFYKKNVQKYEGREELLDVRIPLLNCKWNDVVHFSSIDPTLIAKELLNINPAQKFRRAQYFRIRIDQIANKYEAAIFDRPNRVNAGFQIEDFEMTKFSSDTYKELKGVPKSTIEYWIDAKTNNRPLLWFMHVPHVLVLGEVETKDFEVCEFSLT